MRLNPGTATPTLLSAFNPAATGIPHVEVLQMEWDVQELLAWTEEKQRTEDRAHYEREIRSSVRAFLVLGGSVTDIHRFVYEEMETLEW